MSTPMVPELFRIQGMNLKINACLVIFLASSVLALPTELTTRAAESSSSILETLSTTRDQPQNRTTPPRQTITYILGHPSRNGVVQSPAELLSPDRYEFYTFDDDGQIIKKLMSVEEIQRIIANSRNGLPPDTENIGDYYQVLTVSPEIESQPAIRVNPHEPLFSIHDVITSVQKVLKAEISSKVSHAPIVQEADKVATPAVGEDDKESNETTEPGVDDYVIANSTKNEVTIKSPPVQNSIVSAMKTTSPSPNETEKILYTTQSPKTTESLKTTETKRPTTIMNSTITTVKPTTVITTRKPSVASTTKKPTLTTKAVDNAKKQTQTTEKPTTKKFSQVKTQSSQNGAKPTSATTHININNKPTMKVEVLKVTTSVSQSSGPISAVHRVTTLKTSTVPTTTSTKTVTTTSTTSVPPVETTQALVTDEKLNATAVESSISEERVAPTSEPLSLIDAHPAYTSNETYLNAPLIPDSVFAIENLLFDNIANQNESRKSEGSRNFTLADNALNEVQIPINQDLAESVSSVLSQIANEISANNQFNLEDLAATTTNAYSSEELDTTRAISTTTEDSVTTNLPLSEMKNSEEFDYSTESTTLTSYETTTLVRAPFRPQNKPMAFSKKTIEAEVTTTEGYEEGTTTMEPLESRTDDNDIFVTEMTTPFTTDSPSSAETTTVSESNPTTITIITLPELEKKIDVLDRVEIIKNDTASNDTIEIIQESETGRIPRPTQQPEEISTRPGSSKITTISVASSTGASTLTTTPIITTSSTPLFSSPELTTESVELISESDNGIIETVSNENAQDESVENFSISFIPMIIQSSTTPEPSAISTTSTEKQAEKLILPPSDELIEPKVALDEVLDDNSDLDGSNDDEKTDSSSVASSKEASSEVLNGSLKQNYGKPQNNVKLQKPVFIKPTKSKPQLVDAKPTKPARPMSSAEDQRPYEPPLLSSPSALELDQAPAENLGLEATTVHLNGDVRDFVDLCNELAFSLWSSITHNGLSFVRSVVISPFAVTSLLAMVFLGARGPTSGQMNDILKLDDVVTFNPHLVFRNVTESLVIARNPGVATASFVRELYSDRSKGKLLDFYKERAQQFYDGHVEEVNFKAIGETLRRQTNHLVKRQTWGKVKDFLQGSTLMLRAPLAAFSANIFQADCSRASVKDRDGEMYFVVLPSSRMRRLVPVPAAVWRDDFLAGYEPNLDATVAAVGAPGGIVSTIFVMPGQQGLIAPGDSLARLEHHLLGSSFKRGHWSRLMRSLLRRPGLELQVPRLSHKSVVNATASLQKMGLRDLFSAEKADLTGLNGLANDLHLSDMVQVNMFSTCGDDNAAHHSEYYPASPLQRREKSTDNIFAESIESLFAVSDFEDPSISALPLELRPRQARIPGGRLEGRTPEPPRLRLDRPFLFFVRHNPTGIILHIGRFNPRLVH